MCSLSSSAERSEQGGIPPGTWAGRSRWAMIHQAYAVGPATVWLIDRLWNLAAQEAYWQSLEVFQFAAQYSPTRVERAVIRLMDREQAGLNQLRFVLAQELDRLSDCRDADLQGQLTFPFMRSQLTDRTHHSGNERRKSGIRANWFAAIMVTGARASTPLRHCEKYGTEEKVPVLHRRPVLFGAAS